MTRPCGRAKHIRRWDGLGGARLCLFYSYFHFLLLSLNAVFDLLFFLHEKNCSKDFLMVDLKWFKNAATSMTTVGGVKWGGRGITLEELGWSPFYFHFRYTWAVFSECSVLSPPPPHEKHCSKKFLMVDLKWCKKKKKLPQKCCPMTQHCRNQLIWALSVPPRLLQLPHKPAEEML